MVPPQKLSCSKKFFTPIKRDLFLTNQQPVPISLQQLHLNHHNCKLFSLFRQMLHRSHRILLRFRGPRFLAPRTRRPIKLSSLQYKARVAAPAALSNNGLLALIVRAPNSASFDLPSRGDPRQKIYERTSGIQFTVGRVVPYAE